MAAGKRSPSSFDDTYMKLKAAGRHSAAVLQRGRHRVAMADLGIVRAIVAFIGNGRRQEEFKLTQDSNDKDTLTSGLRLKWREGEGR